MQQDGMIDYTKLPRTECLCDFYQKYYGIDLIFVTDKAQLPHYK